MQCANAIRDAVRVCCTTARIASLMRGSEQAHVPDSLDIGLSESYKTTFLVTGPLAPSQALCNLSLSLLLSLSFIMPSLRRAFSTPSVRASPYSVLPSSRSHRPHPHGHRRSSGSDVADRKVLADIDWWRVADGQRERGSEEEGEEERDAGEDPTPISAGSADSEMPRVAIPGLPTAYRRDNARVEPEHPSTPVMSESPLGGQFSEYSSQVNYKTKLVSKKTSFTNVLIYFYPFSCVPYFFFFFG